MNKLSAPLDADFIQQQRQRLETLQSELVASLELAQNDEDQMHEARHHTSHTTGGDAQKNALQDNDRAIRAHDREHLTMVRRALEKIEDGSYGRSDESGDVIPRARLEAVPASLYTLAEEEARERDAARGR